MARCYTAAEISEMAVLADEARAMDIRYRELMVEVSRAVDTYADGSSLWMVYVEQGYCQQLAELADILSDEPTPTAYHKLNPDGIAEGRIVRSGENVNTWRKRNNAMRRHIARIEKALAKISISED